ncbi:DUF2798 domain-containing protein [Enterovibrio coralii]|uniref:MFS transporter permease n=1 Tax=Enterovibrio coralii TaxID=294935 RepID=A0A135IBI4_9GAMM|nr:DUF2798 domain-containing protein [Enterovibrio coralii]KXF82817.1 MFS transporter permease [Enterovibrio coralii]
MKNKQFWISTTISTATMAMMMSGVISGYKMGFSSDWPAIWLDSFQIAWPCAFILNLTVLPQVRKAASWLSAKV